MQFLCGLRGQFQSLFDQKFGERDIYSLSTLRLSAEQDSGLQAIVDGKSEGRAVSQEHLSERYLLIEDRPGYVKFELCRKSCPKNILHNFGGNGSFYPCYDLTFDLTKSDKPVVEIREFLSDQFLQGINRYNPVLRFSRSLLEKGDIEIKLHYQHTDPVAAHFGEGLKEFNHNYQSVEVTQPVFEAKVH